MKKAISIWGSCVLLTAQLNTKGRTLLTFKLTAMVEPNCRIKTKKIATWGVIAKKKCIYYLQIVAKVTFDWSGHCLAPSKRALVRSVSIRGRAASVKLEHKVSICRDRIHSATELNPIAKSNSNDGNKSEDKGEKMHIDLDILYRNWNWIHNFLTNCNVEVVILSIKTRLI